MEETKTEEMKETLKPQAKVEQEESSLDSLDFNVSGDLNKLVSETMLPRKEKNLYLSLMGGICIKEDDKYIGFDASDPKKPVPVELMEIGIIKMPVISMPCDLSEIQKGDNIITMDGSLGYVYDKYQDGRISYLDTKGNSIVSSGIKNELTGRIYARRIMSFGNLGGGKDGNMNKMLPMLLMAKGKKGKKGKGDEDSMLKMYMMSQMFNQPSTTTRGADNTMQNPMMLMLMSKMLDD